MLAQPKFQLFGHLLHVSRIDQIVLAILRLLQILGNSGRVVASGHRCSGAIIEEFVLDKLDNGNQRTLFWLP